MFTGIIEEVGTVAELKSGEKGGRLRIECGSVLPKLRVASSVAVSGCCLTVVEKDKRGFACDLAPETLNRTGFRRLAVGAKVNLEAGLTPSTPRDGHIVQGHVDGTGTLVGLTPAGDPSAGSGQAPSTSSGQAPSTSSEQGNFWLDVDIPESLTRYLVEKGSVAVEGISLTVAAIKGTRLRIAIIPFTVEQTNLRTLRAGDPVNLECDVLAKYVEKLLLDRPPATAPREQGSSSNKLTVERLVEEGF
ncbi:MAG: riboflavin synthase [Acidobacteria bacterium]|nr:riboflavin synthase [Acidobacteriota bacterium]